jgi:hypothetical protein
MLLKVLALAGKEIEAGETIPIEKAKRSPSKRSWQSLAWKP